MSAVPAPRAAEAVALPRALTRTLALPFLFMAAAVFPAYWLARRIVRPSFALLTAAATVATPAMVYHGYLMSEALAYPMFLFAVAVIVRGVEKPSRWTALVVPAMCT